MNRNEHNLLFQDHPLKRESEAHSNVVSVITDPLRPRKLRGKRLFVANQIRCTSSRVYVKAYENFMKNHGCDLTTNENIRFVSSYWAKLKIIWQALPKFA